MDPDNGANQLQRSTFRRGTTHRDFTLIELLTVIVIVALLFSILLPALAKARHMAEQMACTNNLRQIGTAVTSLYAADYNGYGMPAEIGNNVGSWMNYLYEEENQGQPSLYSCPEYSEGECFNPYGGNNAITNGSYVMNTIGESSWGTAPVVSDNHGWCNNTRHPVRLNRVTNTSETIVITDGAKTLTSADARGIVSYAETDRKSMTTNTDIGRPHNGGFNVLWADTHIEHRYYTRAEEWTALEE